MAAFPLSDLTSPLRVAPGPIDLSAVETDATPGFDGDKGDGEKALQELAPVLEELQERLFADGTADGRRSILLVLQGMDTSGKGGTLRSTVGLMDPQGVRITSFKAPTEEERKHDFLWRITKALPPEGLVGVFDRSHYEDVLIARVRELAPPDEIRRRYQAINDWEADLVEQGTTIIKCMLHISAAEQKERLLARLDDPTKHWKYNPGDVDERELWPAYQEAYELAIERTNTDIAPWHVIPADRKWYRNLAIGTLLLDALRAFDLSWPEADFDVEHEKQRLLDEKPL
ncbi:PPK2 family polyphosphate:nucleotide phosphotransferase [Nocardioides aromaticivorans]|uniref:PPK2 family polyphosphate:nucleotide phosphotransferase n=1 Tax=Nocardioides aromaticivorans TaxID=200618 RepID=A0A7Y9ZMP9_9ACTN|nr:polyphosphate kinase 2 family protein [Nocardioides aromaticivorans]NYI47690.1 PPK2 family polyphosphate:nucleotide phosphotransferase [Nocardioides aromaticivorans]